MLEPDFSSASSEQIEKALSEQLTQIRLTYNITQIELAKRAGVAVGTIRRLENGQGVSLNTFIRLLKALGFQQNLEVLLPDPTVRPIERVRTSGVERVRARPRRKNPQTGFSN